MLGRGNLKGVLVVMLAALFVAAFAYQAAAIPAGGSTPFTYTGKIVSLDTAAKIVTVQAGPRDELTFNLNDHGTIMKCSMLGSFTDLKIGDMVTVSYFDQGGGKYVANEINLDMQRC